MEIASAQFIGFTLILLRVSAVLFTAPFFSSENVPTVLKVGMAAAFSLSFSATLPLETYRLPTTLGGYLPAAFSELAIGLIIGYSARLIFAAVQLSGQLMSYQMGFAVAQVIDPLSNIQMPTLSQFQYILAFLVFLSVNAHHWFIKGIAASFRAVPIYGFNPDGRLLDMLVRLSGEMFLVAVKIGAPVIVALTITMVALGLLAKTVPQINLFMLSMPLNIAIGLTVLGLSLPFLIRFMIFLFDKLGNDIFAMIHYMAR